jgi:GNAT superfamily N-acetyltransferase
MRRTRSARPTKGEPTRIRPARLDDADAIARVHVQAWRETYRGLIPDGVLAGLSVAGRVRAWSEMIGAGEAAPAVLVAERGGGLIGFASARMARDEALGTDAELTSIYLLDGYKRRGIGRLLFEHIVEWLRERGGRSLGLWVLDTNGGARAFYAALGGRTGARKTDARPAVTLQEIAYVWDDIRRLGSP